jgi:hypothetical protein
VRNKRKCVSGPNGGSCAGADHEVDKIWFDAQFTRFKSRTVGKARHAQWLRDEKEV